MAQEETEIKKKQNKKTQQPLRMQSRPSPSQCVPLLFHAVWFSCFLLSLLLVAVLLIWQQLALPGRGGLPALQPHKVSTPQPLLLHCIFPCGACQAAAEGHSRLLSLHVKQLGLVWGLWVTEDHLSLSLNI